MTATAALEVHRTRHGETRLVDDELGPLAEGHVRLRVDRLAVTANTVTYAVFGDSLGYWDFFPTGDPEWGRVPAMGWADVVESAHPEVPTGDRFYGWFPMATHIDMLVTPIAEGLRDDGAHRSEHAAVYRTYSRTTDDPRYPRLSPDDDALGDAEDRHALLRGLFLTGFLADAYLDMDDYFGAEQVIVLSASSKTAIGFADQASKRAVAVIGVTAPANLEFVRSLGCYRDVVTYDDITTLPAVPSVSVDMAGNGAALEAVHTHFGDQLLHSMIIGKSHHDSPATTFTAGPTPQFFFAPTAAGRLLDSWGPDEFQRRSAESTHDFVSASREWLTVQRSTGPDAAAATWREVYDGSVPPNIGRIISLHD
jgi:hypothetical protein